MSLLREPCAWYSGRHWAHERLLGTYLSAVPNLRLTHTSMRDAMRCKDSNDWRRFEGPNMNHCRQTSYPISYILYTTCYIVYPIHCVIYTMSHVLFPIPYLQHPVSYLAKPSQLQWHSRADCPCPAIFLDGFQMRSWPMDVHVTM